MAFSRPVLERIALGSSLDELRRIFQGSGLTEDLRRSMPLRDWFDCAYAKLMKEYRSQYVYKNAIANKLLLGRHSLRTAALFTEFIAGVSKADAVLINGTSTVYEIKSEFDSVERLQSQLGSYGEIFDRIYVCTHVSQIKRIEPILPAHVGIILLSSRYTLQEIRQAQSNKARVVPGKIFYSLRRAEYCSILQKRFGALPPSNTAEISIACHKLFSTLAPEEAHDAMVEVLRVRQGAGSPGLINFVKRVPTSLRAAALYAALGARQQDVLIGRLDKPVAFA